MLTLDEHISLKADFISEKINLKEAQDILWKDFDENNRSWHTPDWKERRKLFIKDYCECCDSQENLLLQHLSHPQKFSEHKSAVTREYANAIENEVIGEDILIDYIKNKYDYYPVAICPKCDMWNPNERSRKLPKYLCTSCRHEFDEPKYTSLEELVSMFYNSPESTFLDIKCFISNDGWNNKHNLNNIKYYCKRNLASLKNEDAIERKAFILYLDDNIKYLSFEDTITACKRCAYYADKMRMDICPQCKTHYKGFMFPTCIPCLPEEKRNEILEQLEFNKNMNDVHRDSGID
jgi:transposase-like protein